MRSVASTLGHPYGPGRNDVGRFVAGATAIVSIAAGVIHVSAAADHENLPVMMAAFLCVATAQVALGGLLLWRHPSRLLLVAALALMLGSIGVWLMSRTIGLPFLPDGHMEPIGFKDGVTVLFELASVPGLLLLFSRELAHVTLPSPRLGSQALAFAGVATFVLFVPALVLGGGEHHSHEQAVAMGIHSDDDHDHGDEGDGATASGGGSGHGAGDDDGDGTHAGGHSERGGSMSQDGGHGHDSGGADGDELAAVLGGGGRVGGGGGDGHGHDGGDERRERRGHGHGNDKRERDQSDHGEEHSGDRHPGGDPGGGHGGDDGSGHQEPPGDGGSGGGLSVAYKPAEPGKDGRPPRGSAISVDAGEEKKPAHGAHDGPCQPTPEQQAAADDLYRKTAAALRKYDNNPARALADGYYLAFTGTAAPSRYYHMFSAEYVYDTPSSPPRPSAVEPNKGEPVILDPNRIESFMYAMTDRGLTAIGGMYMMPAVYNEAEGDLLLPRQPKKGPELGGCLTRWHDHPDLGKATNRSGAPTPQMLHVWTYPGLEPYGEYDGRELAYLWTPGSYVPTIQTPLGPGPIVELLLDALKPGG